MQICEPLHGQDPSMKLPRSDFDRLVSLDRLVEELSSDCGAVALKGGEFVTCELAIQNKAAP